MNEVERLLKEAHADMTSLRKTELPQLRAALAERDVEMDRRIKIRDRIIAVLSVVLFLAVAVLVKVVLYATCNTDRTAALSGPGNNRINLFLQAYTEAAGQIDHPLTSAERQRIITGLDGDRGVFSVLPAHDKLEKQTDFELLGLRDLVASLRANADYKTASAAHPVCSLWSL